MSGEIKLSNITKIFNQGEAEEVIALAKEDETIKAEIAGKNIVKELYVPGKLVNIVAK